MFGRLGWVEIAVIALVVLVLFGRGKIGAVLEEMGKGVRAFKDGMNEAEAPKKPAKPRKKSKK
ncbi:MAG: twin-arginine translocase TatA/TatE family subunit [Alphaproteobacteria bacterium CG_4_10_14_0_8_um_filter_53_9]|nr:MAG: twin-arginine translocase TatA/TatE family subunit [Alphaproteobacteria bacterium CG_4_10_14_0_8_um_filter_53_9]